ncbi:hypothetical protein BT96DRAFT_924863 [Gymnopus androsaceus JB14]|uniref:Uncharacterized protein n=1 Tax=Gymnopus androsaceus JB14 TaxID=1447944 RepID=A0A6A4H284_9AGAR|nr:hypothetical protein BT96DRAFT_924863 [Gymnopus androsaceus JB14]
MTPEESEQITAAGASLFQNISALIFQMGLLGVYILAFIISMSIILQKENNGWAHKGLIALLLAGFAMLTLTTCASFASNLILVQSGFVVSLSGGLIAEEMAANLKSNVPDILSTWSSTTNALLADIAIVWRAWALFGENRLIRWTIMILLLLDIGVNIADDIAATRFTFDSVVINNNITLDWVSTVLNLTVNIVGTSLIGYRAWTHHKSIHAISRNSKTQVEKILQLIVESGAIFGVIQATNIIFSALDIHAAGFSPVFNAGFFLDGLYIYSAALSPVMLVILIQTGNTYEHSFHLEDVPSLEIP